MTLNNLLIVFYKALTSCTPFFLMIPGYALFFQLCAHQPNNMLGAATLRILILTHYTHQLKKCSFNMLMILDILLKELYQFEYK